MEEYTREEKKIVKARVAMLIDTPFYGHIAMQLRLVASPKMFPPTMGTDGYRLFYSPEFVEAQTLEHLKGILAHEIAHLILMHLTRKQNREHMRWNFACVTGETLISMADGSCKLIKDVQSGDQIIGYEDEKPVIGRVLSQFAKSSDKIVEVSTINRKLTCTEEHQILTSQGFKEAGEIETGTTKVVTLGATNQGFEQERVEVRRRNGESREVFDLITTCHSYIANGIVVHNCDFAVNDLIKLDSDFELPDNILYNPAFTGKTAEWIYNQLPETETYEVTVLLDNHEEWGKNGNGKGEDGEGKGGDGEEQDDEYDMGEGLEQRIREMVATSAAVAKMKGKMPGYLKELIDGVLQPKLDWKSILRDMIVSCAKSDFTMFPPNKKHLYRGFCLPGITGTEINIAVVIDTSGSISSQEMNEFMAEIKGICDSYEEYTIHLMTCDTEIHQQWEIRPFDSLPNLLEGRGSTDFRKPFKEAEQWPITTLVYLTDGYGPFPEHPPYFSTIWVSTTDAQYPWGQVIKLPERQ